jgi:membrane fusion protein (multidrug efflux system)
MTDSDPRAHPKPAGSGIGGIVLRLTVMVVAIGLILIFATRFNSWTSSNRYHSTDDAYLESDVTPLAAHVPGYVRSVAVGDFDAVRKGQLLIQLDDADYRAQVAEAEAAANASKSALNVLTRQRDQQGANVDALRAAVESARAAVHLNHAGLDRQQKLYAQGRYASAEAVDQAVAADQQAGAMLSQQRAQVVAAERQLATIDAQIEQAQAALMQQQAAADLARINLGYTRIVAPADGRVGVRRVRDGQYVSAGTQLIDHVALPNVWVVANFRETQMANIRAGQPAKIKVDAFPQLALAGHVDGWSPASGARFALLPPDNATGNFTKIVQRLPVKIVLDSSSSEEVRALLRPGMSVIATIDTASVAQR